MAYELFERRVRRITGTPVAGIQSSGMVSLNHSAYALLRERLPKGADGDVYVQWLYDTSNHVVAMRPATNDTKDSYVVRKQPSAAGFILNGKAFLAFYGIGTETRRYRIRQLDESLVGFSLVTDRIGETPEKTPAATEAKTGHTEHHTGTH